MSERDEKGGFGRFQNYLVFSQLGFELLAGAGVGIWLGDWLDSIFGTVPILTFLLPLLLVAGVLVHLYQLLTRLEQETSGDDEEPDDAS